MGAVISKLICECPPIRVAGVLYVLDTGGTLRVGPSAKTVRPALRLLEEAAGYKGALGRRPPARAKIYT